MNHPQRDLGRVLVTGAAGFLGAALMRVLRDRSVETTATDIGSTELPAGIAALDVRDLAAVTRVVEAAGCDTIFHCGAVSGPMVMADRPLDIWHINATGTANLLEAARRARVGRVVVCSTVDVYGEATGGVADEAMPPRPDTVYGASKAAAEQAALAYHREHGLDTVALRLSWIYGPGRKTPTMLATLLRDALRGGTTHISGRPADMTHYIFIEDAVAGLIRAAEAGGLNEDRVFNITAGAGRPLAEILNDVQSVAPQARYKLDAVDDPTRGPTGYSQERAERLLGFRAGTDFRTGLARYIAALRQDAG